MGVTKEEMFTTSQNYLASIAKVLGHPARIAILELINERESCICGDLVNDIGLAQPTISQHLKELKKVGLIKGSVEGTRVCYCINKNKWKEIQLLFRQLFETGNTHSINCC